MREPEFESVGGKRKLKKKFTQIRTKLENVTKENARKV